MELFGGESSERQDKLVQDIYQTFEAIERYKKFGYSCTTFASIVEDDLRRDEVATNAVIKEANDSDDEATSWFNRW